MGSHDDFLKNFLVEFLEMTNHGWSIAIIPEFVSFQRTSDLMKMIPKTDGYKDKLVELIREKHIQLIHENLSIEPTICH